MQKLKIELPFVSRLVASHSLQPHRLQHARLPCPSPSPKAYSNSCPLSWWCHPTISSSVVPFSCLQSFPAAGSFLMSQLFASGGQSIGASASASVPPMNIQGWFPLGLTGLISLQSKDLYRFFNIKIFWQYSYTCWLQKKQNGERKFFTTVFIMARSFWFLIY